MAKISLAKFAIHINLRLGQDQRRAKMAWRAPKIAEVSVGMEINMYACAARK